jgi:DNA-directed RNA polymerase III subunit RPC2
MFIVFHLDLLGLLLEGIQSKAALFTGEKINATAFTKHSLEKASDVLEKNGLRGDGTEEFEMSDGTPIRNRIFFVPLSDCPLKHQTEDKIQSRDYGKKNIQTRQPVGGRENAGAIRFGEMERAVLSGYGCSASIQDRMLYASDFFEMMICSNKNCGRPIKSNPLVKDKFEPVCDTCDEPNVKKIQIPFASWLFFNILGACAVDTQIRV